MSEKFIPHTLEGDRSPQKVELLPIVAPENSIDDESSIQLRELINQIDEQVLKELLFEELQRCGIEVEETNFIPLTDVAVNLIIDTEPDSAGVHVVNGLKKSHYIALSPAEITAMSFQKVLWTIIHEELHSISTVTNVMPHPLVTVADINTGVQTTRISVDTLSEKLVKRKRFSDFNEGLTELLSERIFIEYCRRTGEVQPNKKVLEHYHGEFSYGAYRQKVDFYVGLIHVLGNVERSTAENALVRSYFRNGEVVPDEFKQLLNERQPNLASTIELLLDKAMGLDSFITMSLSLMKQGFLTPPEHEQLLVVWNDIAEKELAARESNKVKTEKAGG